MDFTKLDNLIDSLPACGIPMCDLAVTYKGETVYRHSSGYSDAAQTKPTSKDDIYWIFSNTKIATCIAGMRLVEEGKMSLDDKLSKYIPEFENVKVKNPDGSLTDAKTPITVEHLFTMSAGFNYNTMAAPIMEARNAGGNTLEIVRTIAKVPLGFEPGTNFNYSLCHDVLAGVIEIVSGMKFSEYLDRIIFKPLGMNDTGFRPNEEQKKRFSAMYLYHGGTNTEIPTECSNNYAFTPDYDSGGAGLFSTVDDYLKLVTVISLGGTAKNGYCLLKPETIKLMQENHLTDQGRRSFSTTRSFGYGWGLCGRVHIDPVVSHSKSPVGEFGWDGAAGAFNMMDPENGVALYMGTHVKGCNYVYHKIHPEVINLVYEALGL